MEIKAQLLQPFNEEERINFIVEQNHKLGYEIRQVETTYEVEEEVPYTEIETEEIQVPILDEEGNPVLDEDGNQILKTQTIEKEVVKYRTETVEKTGYNLEAWGYTEEEKQEQRKEQISQLSMTRGDVFEALILAKGLGKVQIRAMIEQAELDTVTKALYLNRFDEALEFYRGYPIFDMLGRTLGITGAMLDRFFETKDYHYLTTCKLTINPTPAEATVVIDSEVINEVTVPYGSVVDYVVSCDGYESKADVFEITKDEILEVVLDENTTDTTESDIQDEVDTTTSKSDEINADILE